MTLFPEPPPSTPGDRGTPAAAATAGRASGPRVQHIPAEHPYVRHLDAPPGAPQLFTTAPDPGGAAAPGTWRPSPALDPAWIAVHGPELDVVHLHFGYEHLDPEQVTAWVRAVHRAGVRLVVTVHDLDNPHLADQTRQHASVGAALAGADRVLTLTPGAAAEIARRWGRTARVVAHPHVLPPDLVATRAEPRRLAGQLRLGVPLGSLRANVATARILDLLAHADALVRLRLARQVFDPDFTRGDAATVRARLEAADVPWELDVVEPGEPEVQVWRWLSSLEALVLPYAWGTHSAWVEACADVGTPVIAPALGHWAEQQDLVLVPPWDSADVGDLAAAVERLRDPADHAGGGRTPVPVTDRLAQRAAVHAAHAEVYRF